ncbi:MAG: hypothetical protein ACP5HS_05850 [Anaerolineae bacterium]
MKQATLILLLLALTVACGGGAWLARSGVGPLTQDDLAVPRIYAYRDWQSVGAQLDPGDVVNIRARGRWLYTPGEYHGPEGHATYPAPDTYPISGGNVPGGVLLGRIGEEGDPFMVGRGRTVVAGRGGLLYFRINDDILTDNEGFVTVEYTVERATSTAP